MPEVLLNIIESRGNYSQASNLRAYWRMDDNSTYPIILDVKGNNNGVMNNMNANDFEADTP